MFYLLTWETSWWTWHFSLLDTQLSHTGTLHRCSHTPGLLCSCAFGFHTHQCLKVKVKGETTTKQSLARPECCPNRGGWFLKPTCAAATVWGQVVARGADAVEAARSVDALMDAEPTRLSQREEMTLIDIWGTQQDVIRSDIKLTEPSQVLSCIFIYLHRWCLFICLMWFSFY